MLGADVGMFRWIERLISIAKARQIWGTGPRSAALDLIELRDVGLRPDIAIQPATHKVSSAREML